MNAKQAHAILTGTLYELDGVLALPDGRALASVGDNLARYTGKQLESIGLDVVKLLDEDYLTPLTNQGVLEEALSVLKRARAKAGPTQIAQGDAPKRKRGRPPKAKPEQAIAAA